MSAPAYPVAATVEAALHASLGVAAREGEAAGLAGGPVVLATEAVGPAFATREAAVEAYASRLDAAWCSLRPVLPEGRAPASLRPLAEGPRRWPQPVGSPALWRLQVSYWRTRGAGDEPAPSVVARRVRRHADGARLDGLALRRLAAQPMQAVRPQQPLDIGLFEARAPEAPDLILPDD